MSESSRSAAPLPFFALAALALNGIVGVGIFFAPKAVVEADGAGALVPAFALAFAAFLPSLGVFMALARLVPDDGGPVAHARRAFGVRAAFVVGCVASLSSLASTAAVLRGFAEGVVPAHARAGAIAALALAGLVTARGLVVSAKGWSLLTALKVAAFVAVLVDPAKDEVVARSAMAWPSASAVLVAAFCFQGFEVTSMLAGRGRAASAMASAFLLAALLYGLVIGGGHAVGREPPGALASLSAGGIAFAMVAMTPRYLEVTCPPLGARRAWLLTEVGVAGLVVADSLASLFALATLAVVAQYVSSAVALAKLSTRPWARVLAGASVVFGLWLGSGASMHERAIFAVVVFAAWGLSRTVTGATPPRHAS